MLPLLGAALIALLAVDVFGTVFHSRGRGGPLNRRLNDHTWAIFRRIGRRDDGSTRDEMLAAAGPVLVLSTLIVWVVIFVGSFALVYYPWIHDFLVSPGALRSPWAEALYYSGYTGATLGVGDIVPDSDVLRILAPLQAFGGFALLSAAVTYFLAVYREVLRMQALASDIAAYVRPGTQELVSFVRDTSAEPVARWTEPVASALSQVLLAHFEYPILHYFRPIREDMSLPVQLGRLIELDTALRTAEPSPNVRSLLRHPSYRALRNTVDQYLREVDRLFLGGDSELERRGGDASLAEDAHRRLLRYMLHR